MRRNRIVWGILWILSLIAISFYGGAISYGFFILMTMIPMVSIVYLLYAYSFFHIYQDIETRHPVANDETPFLFNLVNEYHLAFFGVRVSFCSSYFSTITGLSDDIEYELLPMTQIKKTTGIICKYRGEYEIGIKSVELQDFFRLFKVSYRNPEPMRVVVRPALISLDSFMEADIDATYSGNSKGSSELDCVVRKYVPGDDPRQIHWRASAKTSELMVRTRIGNEKQGVGIVIGTERVDDDLKKYIPKENKVMELAIAIALYFTKKQIPVSEYHLSDDLVKMNINSDDRFEEFYSSLSSIQFHSSYKEKKLAEIMNCQAEVFNYKQVFFIVHSWCDEIEKVVKDMAQSDVNITIFQVGYEKDTRFMKYQNVNIEYISPEDDLREVLR